MKEPVLWLLRLIPAVALAVPLVFIHLLPVEPKHIDDRARAVRRLRWGTLGALVLHAIVQTWIDLSAASAGIRVGWAVGFGYASMYLLFLFGRPAFTAASPVFRGLAQEDTVRGASLVPRHRRDPVPRVAWVAGWVVFVAATAVASWSVVHGAPWPLLVVVIIWPGYVLAAKVALVEPEPLGASAGNELLEAWEELRATKAWMNFAFGFCMTVTFSTFALGLATDALAALIVGVLFSVLLGAFVFRQTVRFIHGRQRVSDLIRSGDGPHDRVPVPGA